MPACFRLSRNQKTLIPPGIGPRIMSVLRQCSFTGFDCAQSLPTTPLSLCLNNTIFCFVAGFAFFAFILTLLREVIKDTEDRQGDEEFGCRTLPVVMGVKGGKTVALLLCLFNLAMVAYLNTDFYSDSENALPFWYITILLEIPLLLLAYIILKAKEKSDFKKASRMTKFIMLSGICFWFVLKYQADNNIWHFF